VALTSHQRYLVHQVHPAKLVADIGASTLSTFFFWQRRLVPGLLAFALPPVVASTVVLRLDLDRLGRSPAGRYSREHMPASLQVVRAASAVLLAVGGWHRRPLLIATAAAMIGLGWSHGFWGEPVSTGDRSD
jgi:hypothetical protein